MKKVLMVCLGNICRSPLAEGVMRYLAEENNIEMIIDSAGTNGFHDGESPDSRSIAIARKNGLDISNKISRKVRASDFEEFDMILAMDNSNLRNLKQLSDEKYHDKIDLIMNFSTIDEKEVPDPYYGGEEGFSNVYEMLDDACRGYLSQNYGV